MRLCVRELMVPRSIADDVTDSTLTILAQRVAPD